MTTTAMGATMLEAAERDLDLGLVLAPIPPGLKGPLTTGWNTRERWIDSRERARAHWAAHPGDGIGVIHGPSRTCALDIDNVPLARAAFATLGLDLDSILAQGCRVIGRPERAKALYAVDAEIAQQLSRHAYKADGVTVFELRGGNVQDVLPPTTHPETGQPYAYDPPESGLKLLPVPGEVLGLFLDWPGTLHRLKAASLSPAPPAPSTRPPAASSDTSVIDAFNAAVTCAEILARHGYKQKGDRWLAPNSETGIPGVVRLDGSKVYSHHGADPLADEHAHDAFDCFRILEHGGDVHAAVKAAAAQLGLPNQTARATTAASRSTGLPLAAEYSDISVASRFALENAGRTVYVHPWRAWLVWDGCHWARDDRGVVTESGKAIALAMLTEAVAAPEHERAARIKYALAVGDTRQLRDMLSLAQSEPALARVPGDFDAVPHILNAQNGIVDLTTGALRPHDPAAYCTKLAGAVYDPAAEHPTWTRVIERALPDPETRAFVQRAFGYALSGDPREEKLFLAIGPTATMKSTTLAAIIAAAGDYAVSVEFATFLGRPRNPASASPDLARLRGARLVTALETEASAPLAAALVKHITGGDRIVARGLFSQVEEFPPTFSIFLACNEPPKCQDDDPALWRRLVRIPFTSQIAEAERDPAVKAQLASDPACRASVLAWLVRGCLEWRKHGLNVPNAVRAATAAWQDSLDPLTEWLATDVVEAADATAAIGALRSSYETWCADNGAHPIGKKKFNSRLRSRGHEQDWKGAGASRARVWCGLRLAMEPRP